MSQFLKSIYYLTIADAIRQKYRVLGSQFIKTCFGASWRALVRNVNHSNHQGIDLLAVLLCLGGLEQGTQPLSLEFWLIMIMTSFWHVYQAVSFYLFGKQQNNSVEVTAYSLY